MSDPAERVPFPGRAVASRVTGGVAMLLHPTADQVHLCNDVATFVWQRVCEGNLSARAIGEAVCAEFETDGETALGDVQAFLDQLAAAGFVAFR